MNEQLDVLIYIFGIIMSFLVLLVGVSLIVKYLM